MHVAAPHPVPQGVVETRCVRWAQLFIDLDNLVFETVTYDWRLVIRPGAHIHLLGSYTHQHALVLFRLAREIGPATRAERQTGQSQTTQFQKISS